MLDALVYILIWLGTTLGITILAGVWLIIIFVVANELMEIRQLWKKDQDEED